MGLKNSVILIDEAHNIPQSCEEDSSFELDCEILKKSILELKELQKNISKNENENSSLQSDE